MDMIALFVCLFTCNLEMCCCKQAYTWDGWSSETLWTLALMLNTFSPTFNWKTRESYLLFICF